MVESGKRQILHTANLDFGSVAAQVDVELTAIVKGLKVGAVVAVSAPALDAGLVASAFASDVEEATIRVSNVTVGAIDPAAQDYFLACTQA